MKFSSERAFAKFVSGIPQYVQPANMAPQKYANDFVVKSCKVGDFCDGGTKNVVLFEEVDASIRHSLRHIWARNPQSDLDEVAFLVKELLYVRNIFRFSITSYENIYQQEINIERKLWDIYASIKQWARTYPQHSHTAYAGATTPTSA